MNVISFFSCLVLFFFGCSKSLVIEESIVFGTSADYPPFEYVEKGEIVGFDIDLAKEIGLRLKKKVIFKNIPFAGLLGAVHSGVIDAAISTLTLTEERQLSSDFTKTYYLEGLSLLTYENNIKKEDLSDSSLWKDHKVGVLLGSSMEIWMKKNFPHIQLQLFDMATQIIEAINSGHLKGGILDMTQSSIFCKKNKNLKNIFLGKTEEGYAIALPKKSKLKEEINKILEDLEKEKFLEKLSKKWIE